MLKNNLIKGNLFSDLKEITFSDKEIFKTLFNQDNVCIEQITSFSQNSSSSYYDQDWDEWVVLCSGRAILEFLEEDIFVLEPGDWVFISKNKKHRVKETSPDAVWLAIHINRPNHF